MTFTLYNTITKQHQPFVPSDTTRITFYSCGPTVYDDAHIGNFRSFLAADLLRRWIESPLCHLQSQTGDIHQGPRTVTHVMNITDVGHMTDDHNADGAGQDKMELAAQRIKEKQNESKKDGSLHKAANIDPNDPKAIADFYEARFKKDAIALGLKVAIEDRDRPKGTETLMPRASDHVTHMKQVITNLLNNNHAYTAGKPGSRAIYFNTQSFPNYGKLSGNTLDNLKGGAGGRVDESQQSEKKHPADFLLWKEDNTHKMKWPAPAHPDCNGWQQGYPGWHIECTAMALSRLIDKDLDPEKIHNATIDLHSGGEDNIFPHHECEIAQSCCFTNPSNPDQSTFARHWFHARFLKVEGQKMSKSKGTMYTLSDLTEKGIDPAAVRLELIKTHYRSNADFSIQGLKNAEKRIHKWRRLARQLHAIKDTNRDFVATFNIQNQLQDFSNALSDDLSIAGAIATLDLGVVVSTFDQGTTRENFDWLTTVGEKHPLPTSPMSNSEALSLFHNGEGRYDRPLAALHLIDNVLGVIFRPLPKTESETTDGVFIEHRVQYKDGDQKQEISKLILQRSIAKKNKDFDTADSIRDTLASMGFKAIDAPPTKSGDPSVIVEYLN